MEPEVLRVERLEADEDAAHARLGRALDQVSLEDRAHGARALEHAAHPAQAGEERLGETAVAEEVIVEEVQVPARQALHLRERPVDLERVEGAAALVERVLVTEVAVMR